MNGSWRGTGTASGQTITVQAVISTQAGGALTGTGSVAGGSQGVGTNITGTYAPPTLTIQFNAIGFASAQFVGTAEDNDSFRGTINGSGFNQMTLVLRRQ